MMARDVKGNEPIPASTRSAANKAGSSGIALTPPPPLPEMEKDAGVPEQERHLPPEPWHVMQQKQIGKAVSSQSPIQFISDFSRWLLKEFFEPAITEIESEDKKPLPELLRNRKEILSGFYSKDDIGQPASATAIDALKLFLEKMERTPSNIVLATIIISKLTKGMEAEERWKTERGEVTEYLESLHNELLSALPDVSDDELSDEGSDIGEQEPAGPMEKEDARFLRDHMEKFFAQYEFPNEDIFEKAYQIIVAKYAEWSDVEADRGEIIAAAIKEAEGNEESEDNDAIELPDTIKWEDNTVKVRLELFDKVWWAKARTGTYYRILNAEGLGSKLEHGMNVEIRRPFKDYKGVVKETKDTIEAFGAVLEKVGEETVAPSLPAEQQENLLKAQRAAVTEEHEKQQAPKGARNRYLPRYIDEEDKYEVKWEGDLKVKGKTATREMATSMDINYQTSTGEVHKVPGEDYHATKLFTADPLKGNDVYVSFKLLYLQEGKIDLTAGKRDHFGSGKTETDRQVKHDKADHIATMLTDSSQIGSVAEYNDEDHSHSEQWMIVNLSKDLSVFDTQLASLSKTKKETSIQAFLIDMYSSPNTICDACHPSLEKFFAGSNWKELVTARLISQNKNGNISFEAPEIILRVSANASFSASASSAVSKAKKNITVKKGKADVFFVERTPFIRSEFKK